MPPKPEELPTWEDVARTRRINQKLSAEVQVLKEEIASIEADRTAGDEELDKIRTELRRQMDRARVLNENVAKLERDSESKQRRVVELERENGQLEARTARLLGRTLVVSKDDDVGQLVQALATIRDWCEHDVGKAGEPRNAFEPSDPSVERARLRQVRDECTNALKRAGVYEKKS